MNAVALSTGERTDFLLLIAALEVERADISTRVHLPFSQPNDVLPIRDLLPNGLVRGEVIAALVDIAEVHAVAEPDLAGVRLLLPRDHAEQRRLADAIRADDANNAAGRQL